MTIAGISARTNNAREMSGEGSLVRFVRKVAEEGEYTELARKAEGLHSTHEDPIMSYLATTNRFVEIIPLAPRARM